MRELKDWIDLFGGGFVVTLGIGSAMIILIVLLKLAVNFMKTL